MNKHLRFQMPRLWLLGCFLVVIGLAAASVSAAGGDGGGGYTEWTYYAGPSHTTVVGSRTLIFPHGGWSWGQRTQYCDIVVCSGSGPCDFESSNNCQS